MHESFRGRFRDQAAIETSELPKREDRTQMEAMHAKGERRRGVRCRRVGSAKIYKVREHHFETPKIRLAKSCSPNGDRTRISALRGPRPKPLDDRARWNCELLIANRELRNEWQLKIRRDSQKTGQR